MKIFQGLGKLSKFLKVCRKFLLQIYLLGRAFKMMKNAFCYCCCEGILGCRVIQNFALCKLEALLFSSS